METRGALFDWDESDGMTGWITTQRPHIDRLALSDILEIPAEKMRIIAPRDQGGGFGVKAPFYREPILVAYLAKTLGRPVRWGRDPQEHLMAVSQERDQIHDLEVAAASDGRLLAIRNRGLADCGDGCEGVYWGFLMPFLGSVELPNAYDWPIGDVKVKVAITNKSALSPARAFGEFPTRFAWSAPSTWWPRSAAWNRRTCAARTSSPSCPIPRSPTSISTAATSSRCGTT